MIRLTFKLSKVTDLLDEGGRSAAFQAPGVLR